MLSNMCFHRLDLLYWGLLSVTYLTKFFIPGLDNFASYGRLESDENHENKSQDSYSHQPPSTISKWAYSIKSLFGNLSYAIWFPRFYYLGFIFNAAFLMFRTYQSHAYSHALDRSHAVLACYQLHLFRRVLECTFVHHFNEDKKISLLLWLVGASFYVVVPYTLYIESVSSVSIVFANDGHVEYRHSLSLGWWVMTLVVMSLQSWAHWVLANPTMDDSTENTGHVNGNKKYTVPKGGLFYYVCCPHFLAEILFYTCLAAALISPSYSPWGMYMIVAFTAINLADRSSQILSWYRVTFRKNETPHQWKRLIPGIF